MNRYLRGALLATALTGSVSCGALVAVTGSRPADYRSLTEFQCFESKAGPVADALVAGFALPFVFAAERALIEFGRITTVVYGTSATLGFISTSRCRAAKRELAMRNALAARGLLVVTDTAGPPVPVVIEIVPYADTIIVGGSRQLRGVARAASGALIEGVRVSWKTQSRHIVIVDRSGLVTARAPGHALVTAYYRNLEGSASIVVVQR